MTNEQYKRFIGGARINYYNSTWPLARLIATKDLLVLKVPLRRPYEFPSERVRSVRKFGNIPFFSSGIRIVHDVDDYPDRIVFWCPGTRDKVNEDLGDLGYLVES